MSKTQFNNEGYNDLPIKSPVTNNWRNECKCSGERIISTIAAVGDSDAKWFCTNCGGYTEKKGMPMYSRYGQQRKVLW